MIMETSTFWSESYKQVFDLARTGLTSSEVADRMPEKPRKVVIHMMRRLRLRNEIPSIVRRRGGVPKKSKTLNIRVSNEVYDLLSPHARARNVSVSRLCARIVDAGADCVDAILDDRA